jgi:acetyl esterase/lipase
MMNERQTKRLPTRFMVRLSRMTAQLCVAFLLFLPAIVPAQEKREPTLDEFKAMRIVESVPGMERLTPAHKNRTYKKVGNLNLQMDVYSSIAARGNERRPAIIFVPGDAPWELLKDIKDWGVFVSYGQLAAATGFVGVTFNHRSTEKFAKIRDVAADVDDLVDYVRSNAASLNIDENKICVWAFSAGGPFIRTVLKEKPAFVRCVVAYYSMMGIPKGAAPDEIVKEFTLSNYLSQEPQKVPPVMIVRAGKDVAFINDSMDEFVLGAIKQNISIEFINYVEGVHGFDVENNNERTREIIRRTMEFVKKHLR